MSKSKYILLVLLNFLCIGLQAVPMMVVNQASLLGTTTQNLLVQVTQTEDNKTISWNKVLTYGENLQFDDIGTVSALQITRYGKHQQQDEKINLLNTHASEIKAASTLKNVIKFTIQLSYTGKLQSKLGRVPYAELQMNISDSALTAFSKLDQESREVDPYPDETLVTDKTRDFLTQIFPGLYYRGWSPLGSPTTDSKTLAAYILGIPTPVEENDINGAFSELSRKWTQTRDTIEKSQVLQKALKLQAIKFILDTIEKVRAILASGVMPSVEKLTPALEQLQGTFVAELLIKSRDYLQTTLSGTELREALLSIMRGALVNYALVAGDQELINRFKANCKDSIKNLIWYYYALAIDKNQAFEEGAFIVQDVTGALFNLLRSCEEAKARISTHFNEYLKVSGLSPEERTQYGLNIQGLPTAKKTLLFGKLDPKNNLLFIKPESAGVEGFIETAEHGFSLIHALARKVPNIIERKTLEFFGGQDVSVINALTDYMRHYVGSDDNPSYRKERIPLDILIEFGKLLYALQREGYIASVKDIATIMHQASVHGIHFMYDASEKFLKQPDMQQNPQLIERLQNFRFNLEQNYDHLELRFGREVILLPNEELKPISLEQAQTIVQTFARV